MASGKWRRSLTRVVLPSLRSGQQLHTGLTKGKPDRESRSKPNRSETVTKLPGKYPTLGTMERTLDDIFSAGIAKAKASLKTVPAEPSSLEQQQLWTRKKRENVDTFRNLTKEEWEAKHGRSMSDTFEKEFNALMLKRSEAETSHSRGKEVRAIEVSDRSQKKTYQWDETPLPDRTSDENAERLLVTRHKENLEEGELVESNDETDNDSSSISTSSSDSASSENIAPDVTKLLKVIKEREKVAKKKSLNEAIRDEVAADIEKRKREKERHKERKSRKRKKREKKGKKKKRTRKHKKRAKRNSNSGSDKEVPEKLLTEDEIKKEVKTEPISPVEKKIEKKVAVVGNKSSAVPGISGVPAVPVKSLGNSPAKVNVDYGQKSQLTKTKAQLKQMPENSCLLVEAAVQVEPLVPFETSVPIETSIFDKFPVTHKASVDKALVTDKTSVPVEAPVSFKAPVSDKASVDKPSVPDKSSISDKAPISMEASILEALILEKSLSPDEALVPEKALIPHSLVSDKASVSDEALVPAVPTLEKDCSSQLNPETKTLIPAENLDLGKQKCEKTRSEHEEVPIENKEIEKEKVVTEKEKMAVKEIDENLDKTISDSRISQTPMETSMQVDKPKVDVEKTLESGESSLVVEGKIKVLKEPKDSKESKESKDPKEAKEPVKEDKIPETTTLVEKKPKSPSKPQGSVREKKPKRIDIQAYKARTLERKKKEQEKFKELVQNPISLTTDLLNIPLANKPRISENTDSKLKPTPNSKIKELRAGSQKPTEDSKKEELIDGLKSPIAPRDPRVATKAALEKSSKKEKIEKFDPNKNKVKDSEELKFKFIKSEGGKEMKLKHKPKSSKKIKNESTPLVVIEQKIKSPLRSSSISSESDSHSLKPKIRERTEKGKERENAKKIQKPYNVRKLKIYGKNNEKIEKLISDGLPDTVPLEEISKHFSMELENYPKIQDIIDPEDPVDVCPAKEVFFGNMSLKEDEISEIKNFEIEKKVEEIENIFEESEISNFGNEKPELFEFGIEALPILSETLEELPNKTLIEDLGGEILSAREKNQSPDYTKNEPEQNIQELFEPTLSLTEIVENEIKTFEIPAIENFEIPALEASCLSHVVENLVESRECLGDLIQSKLPKSLHVDSEKSGEKAYSESGEKIVVPVAEKWDEKESKTSETEKSENDAVVKESHLAEIKSSPEDLIALELSAPFPPSVDSRKSVNDFELESGKGEKCEKSDFEVRLKPKPTKISEVVLQTGVKIVRPNLDIASEKSVVVPESETKVQSLYNSEVKRDDSLKEKMGVRHDQIDKNLHKVKHKRKMKKKKEKKIKEEVKEAIKEVLKPVTTLSLLERMKEIDNEIQKLMGEKTKLYEKMAEMEQKAKFSENGEVSSKESSEKQKKPSPEDDEVAFFSKEISREKGLSDEDSERKSKKLSKSVSKFKKVSSSSSDEEVATITKEKQKKLTKKVKKSVDFSDSDFENLPLDQLKKRTRVQKKSSGEEKRKRPKSVMKIRWSDDEKEKEKKPKRPKSVMLFSKDKSSDDEHERVKKKILKRPKSAMKFTSKIEPEEISNKSTKIVVEKAKSEEEKVEKVPDKVPEKRKRPKSVMMKNSPEEEETKAKKIKESPILNTEQRIFVKIRGKHEREKFKKSPEKVEKEDKKMGMPFVQVNRVDLPKKKESPEVKKKESPEVLKEKEKEKDKIKRANSITPKKSAEKKKTLDSALIYSDESTLETLEPNKESKLKKNNTGLALLEQSFRKEMAEARKAREEKKRTPKSEKNESKSVKNETIDEDAEKSPNLDISSDIPGPEDQTPCKGFKIQEKPEENAQILKIQQVARTLFTESNEEESLNEEVQRINATIEEDSGQENENLDQKNESLEEEKEEISEPVLEDSDNPLKSIERPALLSPISDDSFSDSSKKRRRPSRSLSRAGKIPTRSASSSAQRVENCEPPKKRRKVEKPEKVLYSEIRDLLKLEIRMRRKDRKKKNREEMENCKVQLVDLKYTFLRQELPQGVLKRLGLSKINPVPNKPSMIFGNSSLQEEIMKVQEIKRISIDERLEGQAETTCYIFKMDQGKKLAAVKIDENKKEGEEKKKVEVEKKQEIEEEKRQQVVERKNKIEEKKQQVQEEKMQIEKMQEYKEKSPEVSRVKENVEIVEVEENPSGQVSRKVPEENEISANPEVGEIKRVGNPEEENQVENLEDKEIEIPKIQYTVHKGPVLDIKIIGDSFLAASEDGAIYRYSLTSNGILNIYKGHTHAVTCLYVLNPDPANPNRRWMYTGSLDGSMRCYDIGTGEQMQSPIAMGSAVQCMDQAWGAIFIGTTSGHVARYHIKAAALKGDRIQFSNKSVLALKATSEGPRKVLIVASRNQPIMIRDAFTGLFLRQISGQRNYTVYSLLRHNNLIYFGTSSTSIPVYDFVTGEQKVQYNAGVGVVCMYLYERLLFAGCYDGNIYIFDIQKQKLVCSIPGPGKMLLSMAIVNKRIIAGSKDRSLHCWEMPKQAQELLDENT